MKKNFKKRFGIVGLVIVFILSLMIPIFAETVDELEKSKQNSQKAIEQNQSVVDSKQKVINEIEKQIQDLDASINSLNTEINTLKDQIAQVQKDIETTQAELEEAVKKEQEQNDLLNERLRIQYMYGVEGYSEALFSEEDFNDQIENSQIITDIFKADNDLLEQLKANREVIQQKEEQLKNQKISLNTKKTELDSKLSEQENAKTQKQKIENDNKALIAEAKKNIAQEEAAIASANQKIKQIAIESEKKAISARKAEVEDVQSEVAGYAQEVAKLSEEVNSKYGSSNDEKVTEYLRQVQALSAGLSEKEEKLNNIVKDTQNSETAAQAVEKSSDIDNILSAATNNVAEAKNIKSELADLDLAKKKQEAIKAAENAEQKRQQEIKAGQEAVIKEAEEAQRKAEEETKRAEEEAKKAQEEAGKADEDRQDPPAPPQQGTWESSYISQTGWRWPLDDIFDITSLFGYRIHPIFGTGTGHEGLDIGASSGTPIHSCDGGTVILAGENGGYGNCVIIQQDSGHQVYYGHQSRIAVSYGQRVEKGEVIGYVGSTGWSTGPHLHLGVLAGADFVDPLTFFPELN